MEHLLHPHHEFGADFHHPHTGSKDKQLFQWLILLNLLGMLAEIVGGIMTNSLALLSDAGHMFTDFFAFIVAYVAIVVASRSKNISMTYGYFRMEILAAFFNGLTIFGIVFLIVIEAFVKLTDNRPVLAREMIAVALFGLTVNLISALLLMRACKENLNLKAVFLHMVSDTASSGVILLSGFIVYYTHWYAVDVVASCLIAAVIGYLGYGLIKRSAKILLQGVPEHLNIGEIVAAISELPGVKEVHDVHLWELTSQKYVMTGHILTANTNLSDSEKLLSTVNHLLKEKFAIGHTTFQFECSKHAEVHAHHE